MGCSGRLFKGIRKKKKVIEFMYSSNLLFFLIESFSKVIKWMFTQMCILLQIYKIRGVDAGEPSNSRKPFLFFLSTWHHFFLFIHLTPAYVYLRTRIECVFENLRTRTRAIEVIKRFGKTSNNNNLTARSHHIRELIQSARAKLQYNNHCLDLSWVELNWKLCVRVYWVHWWPYKK